MSKGNKGKAEGRQWVSGTPSTDQWRRVFMGAGKAAGVPAAAPKGKSEKGNPEKKSTARRIAELTVALEQTQLEVKVRRDAADDELMTLKAELVEVRDELIELRQRLESNPPKSWCRSHGQYEPGVAYRDEPDYMPEDNPALMRRQRQQPPDTRTSLPLAGLLFNILHGDKGK